MGYIKRLSGSMISARSTFILKRIPLSLLRGALLDCTLDRLLNLPLEGLAGTYIVSTSPKPVNYYFGVNILIRSSKCRSSLAVM